MAASGWFFGSEPKSSRSQLRLPTQKKKNPLKVWYKSIYTSYPDGIVKRQPDHIPNAETSNSLSFTFTYLSAVRHSSFAVLLLTTFADRRLSRAIHTKKKTAVLATQEDLEVDLTLHDVPASLVSEFAEKIVRPYYGGNLNAALQDLMGKALSEQEFIHSHITHIKNPANP